MALPRRSWGRILAVLLFLVAGVNDGLGPVVHRLLPTTFTAVLFGVSPPWSLLMG